MDKWIQRCAVIWGLLFDKETVLAMLSTVPPQGEIPCGQRSSLSRGVWGSSPLLLLQLQLWNRLVSCCCQQHHATLPVPAWAAPVPVCANTWGEGAKMMEPGSFQCTQDRTRGNGHKPKHRRCCLNTQGIPAWEVWLDKTPPEIPSNLNHPRILWHY